MLVDARREPARADGDRLALEILRLELHPLGARHGREDPGQREAAFFGRDLAALLGDDRIDERARLAALLVADHHETQREADLRGGEPDPDFVVHRVDHVLDEATDLRRELTDGRRAAP